MPRLDYLPETLIEPLETVAKIRARRGGTLNEADRTVLHAPKFAHGWNEIAQAVRHELTIPAKLRELAICGVGVLNGAEYEVGKHAPEFLKGGGTDAQMAAIRDFEAAANDVSLFDSAERAVMRLTIEMTRDIVVTDKTFAAIQAEFPNPQQIVEIVGTIAFYNMISRFLVALRLE
jgi:alkylhydroperoxidase family enzyme